MTTSKIHLHFYNVMTIEKLRLYSQFWNHDNCDIFAENVSRVRKLVWINPTKEVFMLY